MDVHKSLAKAPQKSTAHSVEKPLSAISVDPGWESGAKTGQSLPKSQGVGADSSQAMVCTGPSDKRVTIPPVSIAVPIQPGALQNEIKRDTESEYD